MDKNNFMTVAVTVYGAIYIYNSLQRVHTEYKRKNVPKDKLNSCL